MNPVINFGSIRHPLRSMISIGLCPLDMDAMQEIGFASSLLSEAANEKNYKSANKNNLFIYLVELTGVAASKTKTINYYNKNGLKKVQFILQYNFLKMKLEKIEQFPLFTALNSPYSYKSGIKYSG